jgi:hypothetical protein
MPAFLVVMVLFARCREVETDVTLYTGFYSLGFEVSAFTPCGSEEKWWTGGAELVERYRDLNVEQYREVFVRLRGNVSEEGNYGHLGAYNRQFEVSEVVEIREVKDGDCR